MTNSASQRIRVAVIYGGRSSEHSVSCISAGTVIAHLDPATYDVIPVGITHSGEWTVGESDPHKLVAHGSQLPSVTLTEEIVLSANPTRRGEFRHLDGSLYATADVLFPVLHGCYGEDGTIQGLFELSGMPYVGTGVLSSACGMDKEYTKKLMVAAGLPVTAEVILRNREPLTDKKMEELYKLGLPVFVKPARGGSSIGISKVTDWADFPAAYEEACQEDAKVIVEAEVVGAEVEVGVLQYPDGRVVASVPALLKGTDESEEGFYGFKTKYLDDVVTAQIPAPFEAQLTSHIQELAVDTFHALDCKGLARVDFFVTEDGPVLNEINTMPGLTPISMFPQVFAYEGISTAELFDVAIRQALAAVQ